MANDRIKVVVFNGPPSCGKDTAARGLYDDEDIESRFALQFVRFSSPLKAALASFFAKSIDEFGTTPMEADKDKQQLPNNVSFRQAQIALSETYAKPLFGAGIFGTLIVDRIYKAYAHASRHGLLPESGKMLTLVPDSGFIEELEPVVREFGKNNVMLVKVYREGTSFELDSRSYLDPTVLDVRCERIHNDTTPEALVSDCRKRILKWA